MSHIKKIWCIFIALLIYNPIVTTAQCANGGAEADNFSNWDGFRGNRLNNTNQSAANHGSIAWNTLTQGIVSPSQVIVTPGNDFTLNTLGVQLPMVIDGNRAMRVGGTSPGATIEVLSYSFVVTSANANLSFRYAVVMENNHSEPGNLPFFTWFVTTGSPSLTSTTIPSFSNVMRMTFNDGRLINAGNNFRYLPWQTECVDLTFYVGRRVTINFAVADCPMTPHACYAYIDALCTAPPAPTVSFACPSFICSNDGLPINNIVATNVSEYCWTIEQLGSNNINNVIPNTAKTVCFKGSPNSSISNLLSLFNPPTFSNGFYKITLKGRNCNSQWIETSRVVQIKIPQISVNQYHYRCCGDHSIPVFDASTTVEDNAPIGIFNWYDAAGTFIGNGDISVEDAGNGTTVVTTTLSMLNGRNNKYRVQYIDGNGCKNERWVYVINKTNFNPYLTSDAVMNLCVSRPTQITANSGYSQSEYCGDVFDQEIFDLASGEHNMTYLWNTGETTKTISVRPNIDLYTVTISNGCFSHTISMPVNNCFTPSEIIEVSAIYSPGKLRIPLIIYPKRNPPVPFNVLEWGKPYMANRSYKATEYEFVVADRWGTILHHQKAKANCNGFLNGEIHWDGKNKKGKYVDAGVYNYFLKMKNCLLSYERLIKGNFHLN